MTSESELADLRAVVEAALRDRTDVLGSLAHLCRACSRLLPVDGASVSLMTDVGHRETVSVSDSLIDHIDAVQFSLGEGPCFEAFTTGRPVLVPDLAADAVAWPVFAAQLIDEPVRAIFAFPLLYGAATVGAMNFYRRTAGWLTADELATALQIADIAAVALIGTGGAHGVSLADLPRHRGSIHQATGIIVAEHRIPATQALARLRGYAFATGRLIDDVAADLVTRALHPRDIDR